MTDDTGGGPDGTLFTSRRSRRRTVSPTVVGVGLLVVIGLSVGAWWLWLRSPESPSEPVLPVTVDSVALDPEEPFVLPALGASDVVVRGLVAAASAHPQLAAWLVPDDLIRRFVQAVVDVSMGSSPIAPMEMLIPQEPFLVQPSGDSLLMDPRSPRRYDLLAEVFGSVDSEAAAVVYRRLLPLFEEAYQELGIAEERFEEVLARAIENLLAVEVPEGPHEVRVAVGRFVYADRAIESLTPAEKHMVRMGPENARRLQEKLLEISQELDLPSEANLEMSDTASSGIGEAGG